VPKVIVRLRRANW